MNIMLVSITETNPGDWNEKSTGSYQRFHPVTVHHGINRDRVSWAVCIGIILGMIIATVATNMMGYAVSPSITGIVVSVTFSSADRCVLRILPGQ